MYSQKRSTAAAKTSYGFPRLITLSGVALLLASCVSSDVLESASSSNASPSPQSEQVALQADDQPTLTTPQVTAAEEAITSDIMAVPEPAPPLAEPLTVSPEAQATPSTTTELAALDTSVQADDSQAGLATITNDDGTLSDTIAEPAANAPRKTYLINGLLSAVPFIGYGFRNLKQKMPEAKLYSYMGVVEGPAVIAPTIIKDAEAAYRNDPTTKINLIGISLGADLITVIAERLNEKNVPVNYLGIVDGTNLRPITPNVRVADNLTCSYLDCTKARARLSRGNNTTQLTRKVYKSSHIPLGNHDGLHAHVIAQSK